MESKIVVFTQIPKYNEKEFSRIIHKVWFPGYGDKDWYISVTSMNAFNSGKRRNASKKEKLAYSDRCSWSPTSLFYCYQDEDSWKREQEILSRINSDLDERNMPIIEHKNIWDFYKYIGFDHKKRKYINS